jgi:hypothetical protein
METIVSKMETPISYHTVIPHHIKVMLLLLKDFSTEHTISSLARELEMTRSGMWKVLKQRLESRKYVVMKETGKATSTIIPKLNFKTDELDKYLTLALSMEVADYERWIFNFAHVKEHVSFFILYGSVLKSYAKAKDIDVIGVVRNRKGFRKLHESLDKIQKSESKRIHTINFTESEFREELLKPNKALVEAVKKGIVLFQQENFTRFMKKLHGASK